MKKTSFLFRTLAAALAAGVLAGSLSGCGGTTGEDPSLSILTPSQSIEPLLNKLTAESPDITFDVQPYYGAGVSVHIQERFQHNDLPDIWFATLITFAFAIDGFSSFLENDNSRPLP